MTSPVVLVVDDSPTIRKIVEITLKREGVQVVTASSGVIALATIANTPPQLILLDIMLPKVNGYQICQIIRRNPAYKHIPVVMLSGKDGVFDKVRGKLVGSMKAVIPANRRAKTPWPLRSSVPLQISMGSASWPMA